MPLSLPTIATVANLQSLEYWNAYLWPLMVTRGSDARPVSFGTGAVLRYATTHLG